MPPLTDDPFDLSITKDVHYEYFINREKSLKGIEENLEILENVNGYPVVILVYKDDETICFYSRIGFTENLTIDEKKVLEKYFQEQMNIENKKINKGI